MSIKVRNQPDDHLLPTPAKPYMRYTDRDNSGSKIWRVNIKCFHDRASPLSDSRRYRGRIDLHPEPYDDQDALVQAEYDRRIGAYGEPRISSHKPDKQKHFIAFSTSNHYDMIASVRPGKKLLRNLMRANPNLTKQEIIKILQSQHILSKNGLGGSFKTPDGTVDLRDSISGSWDRESPDIQMACRVAPTKNGQADPSAPSDYYTGRPDTPNKAEQMVKNIFLSEMAAKEKSKGISRNRDGTYTLHVVVNSLESVSPLYAIYRPNEKNQGGTEQEQQYMEDEVAALKHLKDRVIPILDPKTGERYDVRVKPMLFDMQVNLWANMEKILSSSASGAQRSIEISRDGWKDLKDYANEKIDALNQRMNATANKQKKSAIRKKVKEIEKLVTLLDGSFHGGKRLRPAQELLCFCYLTELLGLPQQIHCKSSTDRTSFGILKTVLRQWREMGMKIPDDILSLLNNPVFKELFAASWCVRHAVTRNARGPHGVIHDKDGNEVVLDHETLGIATNNGMGQCLFAADLLPDRYLKKYGFLSGVWNDISLPAGKAVDKLLKKMKFPEAVRIPLVWLTRLVTAPALALVVKLLMTLTDFFPYCQDLKHTIFKAPKNPWLRALCFFPQLAFAIVYRLIFEHFKKDTTFWFGTYWNVPKSRGRRIAKSFALMIPMIIYRMVWKLLFSWDLFPTKVIDVEKDFIKKRRLIKGGKYQKRFEEIGKHVPAKVDKNWSAYNESFMNRFGLLPTKKDEPVRPVREIIYADVVSKGMSKYRDRLGSIRDVTEIYAEFRARFGDRIHKVNGRVCRTPDEFISRLEQSMSEGERRELLLRILSSCHGHVAERGKEHSDKLLANALIDDKEPIQTVRSEQSSIDVITSNWSMKIVDHLDLVQGANPTPHAQFHVKTTVELRHTGRADIAWTLKGKKGHQFTPFDDPVAPDYPAGVDFAEEPEEDEVDEDGDIVLVDSARPSSPVGSPHGSSSEDEDEDDEKERLI